MLNVEVREEKKQYRSNKESLLWRSYRRKATREESEAGLVEQYLPLVKTVVGRLQMSLPSHVDAEDLYSAGLVGLLDAIRHYNPKLGSTFETYARVRIRGAVFDELRHVALDQRPSLLIETPVERRADLRRSEMLCRDSTLKSLTTVLRVCDLDREVRCDGSRVNTDSRRWLAGPARFVANR